MEKDPIINATIEKLTFPPSAQAVLREIDFTVNQGDFIAVTGEAASGKSMLLHAITGAAVKFYDGVLEGSIRILGDDVAELPLSKVCRSVGFMLQEPQNQIVSVTVEEEVAFGPANLCCSHREIKERTAEALSFVGLSGMEKRSTMALSGGQAQRLVLAGILALKTPILLLDQPGAELDPAGKRELYHHIRRLNREQGVTVLLIPDSGVDIPAYANRIFQLKNGSLTEHSPESYAPLRPILPQRRPRPEERERVVSLRDIAYTYKNGQLGCEGIHADIFGGEFVSIMGENGSGKTTLLKLIEGLLTPCCGEIHVFGETITKKSAAKIRQSIGFLFQNPDLQIFASSVREEVAFGIKGISLPDGEREERIDSVLSAVGLKEYAQCHPQKLSRSQRQKLAFASALIHRPRLIIADEPTAGLGEADGITLMELLADFCAKGGTVLLVTHDFTLAEAYSHRVLLLDAHHLIGDYSGEELSTAAPALFREGKVIQ